MIKLENTDVIGWEHAIRGMRNPKNSWEKRDSRECIDPVRSFLSCDDCDNYSICNSNDNEYFKRFWEYGCPGRDYAIGPNDHKLMMKLAKGGPVHAKYRRMIVVYVDITAPLYWWKEFDTYKVGTVANSCSTMHKIADKEFTLEDFSCEHLFSVEDFSSDNLIEVCAGGNPTALGVLENTIQALNHYRKQYLNLKDQYPSLAKKCWWQMIQLLPSSYNQRRTVMLNYEVLAGMYRHRDTHPLDEWPAFCKWIEELPYSEIITLAE